MRYNNSKYKKGAKTVEKAKIDRINYLAEKSKNEGLTDAEREEQAALRAEYIAEFRRGLRAQLDSTVIERPDGSREALKTKKEKK